MTTLTHTSRLVVVECWCGIAHAIPRSLNEEAEKNGHTVYCPLGHDWVVKEPETEKLRKRLEAKEARERALRDQLDASERSNAALRGAATKARKRAAGGACPCCNRSFVDVARHMKTKHPEYAES